jgi:hypothetical protein
MGMLGVPMVDGEPVEPGAQIARGLIHEFAQLQDRPFEGATTSVELQRLDPRPSLRSSGSYPDNVAKTAESA